MTTYILYIDPSSGSLLFQVIIAGILGIWFFFKTAFEKMKLFSNTTITRLHSFLQTTGSLPFLIGLFFVLYKAKEVFILYNLFTIILYTVVIMAATGLLLTALFISTKNLVKSSITLSVFLLIILFYDPIYAYFLSFTFLQESYLKIGYLILFIFLVIVSFVWVTKKNLYEFNCYLNILFVILTTVEICKVTYNHFENLPFKNLIEKKEFNKLQATVGETPVIYHILLDAYTSSLSLKKYFKYDNFKLEDFLKSNGFYIAGKATSNTTATQQSMATTFNMDYQPTLDSIYNNDLLSTSVYRNNINYSRIIEELTLRNYSLINLSIFDIGDSTKFYRSGPITDATNLFQLLTDGTRFSSFIESPPYIDLKSSIAVFDSLQVLPSRIDGSKTFIYAHINMPHDAYCDSSGKPFSTTHQGDKKQKYKEAVGYTNKLLTETVKKILSNSRIPPIIIIHGDHGSRICDESEKHTVLSAYYFPDKDYSMLYDSISLVNTYRVICNKYFKEHFNLLPDKKGCRKIS